jgi:3-phosphoshikimate 1-carboxyvinyltransferase
MTTVRFDPPARGLRGTIAAPPDKSISHRAAILGAMASEPVRVRNYLRAQDTISSLDAMRALGALIDDDGDEIIIRGGGLRQANEPAAPIDVGNAGTLMRLLPGWLAGQEGRSFTLDGDHMIRRRPVDRIAAPLALMGGRIEATDGRLPPFTVHGGPLHGITYELPVASAQIKSCVLLAALLAEGPTTVVEPAVSRDHTERMLVAAGVPVVRDGLSVTVSSVDELVLDDIVVPGDPSSAAFAIAAAVLVRGSRITVSGTSSNYTRTGFERILARMGGIIVGGGEESPGEAVSAGEPIADLEVAHGPLTGTIVEADEVPLAIDELPLVALLGCFAEGETIVRGAEELRVKESDRIDTVVDGLRGLGADIEGTPDGFVVRGAGGLRGGRIASHGDHRLAMLGAVAGLASREGVEVQGMDAADISYPGFTADMAALIRS